MQNNRLLLEKYEQIQVNRVLQDSFQRDLTAFEQYLIQEGLWDTIKQKGSQLVGGAKNALLQPLVKMVLDKIAQSDPEGFKQLQAAAQDPQKLQALLNSPEIQQQQQAISQDVATTTESIDEELYELYLNEAYGHLVPEAWVDPKTGRFVKAGTPGAVERKGASQRDARGRFVKGATPPATQEPPVIQGPGAFLNPGQHGSTAAYAAAQGKKVAQRIPQQTLGQKIAGTADKAAIAGLKGLGKASNLIGKGAQALGQSKLGQAAGGFVGKAVNWIKKNPKISLAAGLALLAATGGAAAIGAGGIAPLITSTLSAGAAGATKGGIAGAAFGGIKNLAQQAQDAKSLKDINWKQAGKEALKKGAVGAAIGGAVGAGANVLGKAAAGVGKVINRYQAGTSGGGVGTTAPTSQASNQGPDFGANDGAQVVQAKQKVVQNTVEWIKNNNSLDIDDKMEHLKNVLGSHGQGADEQYTYALLNAYKRGQVSDETLAKWFTKLARNNTLTAQVVAVQAKQEAAQKALEWIQNNSGTPMSAKLNGIEKILGTAGRGADKSYLTQLLYAQGRGVPGSDETLLKWLNHLASQ